jgi:hypothetical protein
VEAALAMATLVQSYFVRKPCRERLYLYYIREKLCELVYLFAYFGCGPWVGIVIQVLLNMQGTAARGAHDIVEIFEIIDKKPVAACCQVLKPGICHGLAATRLRCWVMNRDLEFIEQFQGGNAYLGVKLIDVAGNKQSDIHNGLGKHGKCRLFCNRTHQSLSPTFRSSP